MAGRRDLSALAISQRSAENSVRVSLNGDGLALNAAAKPSAALLAKLKRHKAGIVALLRQEAFAAKPEPDAVELEERKGMAMASVPEPYLDAWARLQCQKPMRGPDAEWRQAIDAAGRFLDQWGSLAVEFQWTPGDLFDVPGGGSPGGLAWFLNGETVRSLGPEHAVTEGGRTAAKRNGMLKILGGNSECSI